MSEPAEEHPMLFALALFDPVFGAYLMARAQKKV
jgi:hypothetical protein